MKTFLEFFIAFPIAGFVLSLLLPKKNENQISMISFFTVGSHFVSFLGFLGYWIWNGMPMLNIKDYVLFRTDQYEFYIDFFFNDVSAVYVFVGSFLTFLVTVYSRYYMHREGDYKRFFNTILFFYFSYILIVTSGNFETLFIGWEMMGISSFLLIAFYRDRYLPVKNAVKVFSIYRVGDVGLILAMWLSHHIFLENVTFQKLLDSKLVHDHLINHNAIGVFLALMILITAAAKSAQFPFSSWLPRAMEGPTPSSAIFYGSLSVNLGVFLMLRTFPLWQEQTSVRIVIGLMGLISSLLATSAARVQSSIKSQIAYSSIAQIGLVFIEVAAGFHYLALFHFMGNAFLRTYQLLVSPSVVSYLIREQFYNFKPHRDTIEDSWPKRLEYSIYLLSLKEWNLDSFMYRYLWNPLKYAGNKLNFLNTELAIFIFVPTYILGVISLSIEGSISPGLHHFFPFLFAAIGLISVLKAFTERTLARLAWILTIMSHFWIALAVSFNEHFTYSHTLLYLSGIIPAGILGYWCLNHLKAIEGTIDLDRFHGHSYKHKVVSFVFLLACLTATGFPISPTMIGEDLIFTHIHDDQWGLAFLVSLTFIIDGIALVRIYARVFLGPHVHSVYEMAYRSS